MMLLELPDHILIRVFNLLEIKDRLNLTLVCQQLNYLFGSEKALMKNILVNYEDSTEGNKHKYRRFLDSMVSSGRKYRNMSIYFGKNIHVNFVEDFLPLTKFNLLTELDFWLDEIELEDLAMLINNLPNLETFQTGIFDLKNTKNSTEKLICKKLKKLDTALEIFLQMMETPNLIDLEIRHNIRLPLKDLKLDAFCKKIVSLEKLKYLNIDQPINQELTENAKFKLTEISVDYKDWANTINFLKTQNELQIMTVNFNESVEKRLGQDIILSTLMLPKLNNLEIWEFYFTADSRFDQDLIVTANTNIETFSLVQSYFAEEFIIKLIPKLPNLKHLNLNVAEGFFGDKLVILNTLKHLENLEICASECVLPHLNLPKLEDFSLSYPVDDAMDSEEVKRDDEYLQNFFQNHRNLKKVEIRRLISDELWKFMKNNLHHLQILMAISREKRNHFQSDEDFKVEVNSFSTTAKRIRYKN